MRARQSLQNPGARNPLTPPLACRGESRRQLRPRGSWTRIQEMCVYFRRKSNPPLGFRGWNWGKKKKKPQRSHSSPPHSVLERLVCEPVSLVALPGTITGN